MAKQIRRYNFIYNHACVFSGLFEKNGLLDVDLYFKLKNKKEEVAKKYGVPIKEIIISNTVK